MPDVAQFLDNLKDDIDESRRELLSRVALAGRMLYAPHLSGHAASLWQACHARYGLGGGYRVDVSAEFERHFNSDADALATASKVETQVQALWNQMVIDRLRKASAFEAESA